MKNALQPDQTAARVRLPEAEVSSVIDVHCSGPYFQPEHGAENLSTLLGLGMKLQQLLRCLLRWAYFLCGMREVRLALLRGLCDSNEKLVHMLYKPAASEPPPSALESSIGWWWTIAESSGNWAAVKKQVHHCVGIPEVTIT